MYGCAKCGDVPEALFLTDHEYLCDYCRGVRDSQLREEVHLLAAEIGVPDPFESDWIMVEEPFPAHSYICLHKGYKPVHRSEYIGDPFGQVLLDFAEDGTILGIELLVPGTLVYDKKREEEA